MYAHQVIDHLRSNDGRYSQKDIDLAIDAIRNAPKFHFGDGSELTKLFLKPPDFKEPWYKEYRQEVNPPFDISWFDITTKYNTTYAKAGFLILHAKCFNSVTIYEFLCSRETSLWLAWPVIWVVDLDPLKRGLSFLQNNLYLMNQMSPEEIFKFGHSSSPGGAIVCAVNFSLMLLNCKNVTYQKRSPSEKEISRSKNGKQPVFSYHTLMFNPFYKKSNSSGPKDKWSNRVHFQRGHFKTYTIDNPLFGSITGRFWWQAHVRGKNKNGIVMKDYVVET